MAQSWHDRVLIGNRGRTDAAGVATLGQKIETEKRTREFLEEGGLPQPDYVEYGFTCIRLFFESSKTVLVVDIDDPPDGEGPDDMDPV